MPILLPDGTPAVDQTHAQIAAAIGGWVREQIAAGVPAERLVVAFVETLATVLVCVDDGHPTKARLVGNALARLDGNLQRLAERHGVPPPPPVVN